MHSLKGRRLAHLTLPENLLTIQPVKESFAKRQYAQIHDKYCTSASLLTSTKGGPATGRELASFQAVLTIPTPTILFDALCKSRAAVVVIYAYGVVCVREDGMRAV